MAIPVYPSDLNDAEWAVLGPLIPTSKPRGRPRRSDMRRITNGVFTSCAPAAPGAISLPTSLPGRRCSTTSRASASGRRLRRHVASAMEQPKPIAC